MSTATRPPTCAPTWVGHIETTKDALLVFQACFDGKLQHCSRRPHDRERNQLIVSGNVFVYEEQTSGIKRWTDGIPWSPSRILTNFLIYRQLNSPFPPGEKKRATKRTQRPSLPGQYSNPSSVGNTPVAEEPRPYPIVPQAPESPLARKDGDESPDKDDVQNRGLVGSLVDSYEFKEGGLLKKTMTVNVRNVQHHLVSYYSLEDAKHTLKTPRQDSRFDGVTICEQLLKQPKFKFPNIDDPGDGLFEGQEQANAGYHAYAYAASQGYHPYGGYSYHPQGGAMYHHGAYPPAHPQHHPAYSVPPSNAMYGSAAGAQYPHYQYPQHYSQQGGPQYHPGYQQPYPPRQTQAPPAAHPQYNNGATAPQSQYNNGATASQSQYNTGATAPQSQAVSDGYPSHTNGAAPVQSGEQAVATPSQPPHAQAWPTQNYTQPQWSTPPNRPEYQPPAAYRASG